MKRILREIYYRAVDPLQRARLRGKAGLEAEKAALHWGYRRQPPPHVMTTRNGIKMHFDGADFIPLLLDYLGAFELHCLTVADHILGQSDVAGRLVLDIGGNIGAHALQFAHALGPHGKVVAVEAMPFHAETIQRNAALNGFDQRVEVHNLAVGDAEGVLTLGLPDKGNGGCYSAGKGSDPSTRVDVQMTTIDTIMKDHPKAEVALIKMDIEGSELGALKGATATIKTHLPPIMIEINEKALTACGSSPEEVKTLLKDLGYRGYIIGRTTEGKPVLFDLAERVEHATDEALFVHATKEADFLRSIERQRAITLA